MENITKQAIPKSTANYEVIDMSDGVVIKRDDELHTLNSTAYEILELCDGFKSIEKIIETIQIRYPDDDLNPLIHDFIKQLHTSGLVEFE